MCIEITFLSFFYFQLEKPGIFILTFIIQSLIHRHPAGPADPSSSPPAPDTWDRFGPDLSCSDPGSSGSLSEQKVLCRHLDGHPASSAETGPQVESRSQGPVVPAVVRVLDVGHLTLKVCPGPGLTLEGAAAVPPLTGWTFVVSGIRDQGSGI